MKQFMTLLMSIGFISVSWAETPVTPISPSSKEASDEQKLGPCSKEIRSLCSGIKPGEGRLKACFDRNKEKLGKECREKVTPPSS